MVLPLFALPVPPPCDVTTVVVRTLDAVPLLGEARCCACSNAANSRPKPPPSPAARPTAMPGPGVTIIQQSNTDNGSGAVNQNNTVNLAPTHAPAKPPPTPRAATTPPPKPTPAPSRTPAPRPATKAPTGAPASPTPEATTPVVELPIVPVQEVLPPGRAAKRPEPEETAGPWDLMSWLGFTLLLAIVPAALAALGRGGDSRGRGTHRQG